MSDENKSEPGQKLNADPGLMAQIFANKTQVGMGTEGELIARRKFSFRLDGSACAPDFFVDPNGDYFDVTIELQSLSSADEIQALSGLTEASQAPYRLARACVYSINGTKLDEFQKDLLWEGLGMGGRQLVLVAFNSIGGASVAALGKFRETFSPS